MSHEEASEDDEYDFVHETEARYPIHDCCEFEDVDALKRLIFVAIEESDDDDEVDDNNNDEEKDEEEEEEKVVVKNGTTVLTNNNDKHNHHHHHHHHDNNSSSSDENDSTAAAHAAAIGHSPQQQQQQKSLNTLPALPEGSTIPPTAQDENKVKEVKDSVMVGKEEIESSDDKKGKDEGQIIIEQTESSKEITNAITNGDALAKTNTKENIEEKEETKILETTTPKIVVDVTMNDATSQETKESDALKVEAMDIDHNNNKDSKLDGVDANNGSSSIGSNHNNNNNNVTEKKQQKLVVPKMKRLELNRDINLNERDEDDNTALHIAIHNRKLEHVKVLLEAGASFRIRCDGSMPIHTAISIGALREHRQFAYECVVLLHEQGADLAVKDDAVHTPLFLSCVFNLPQVASYILSDTEGLSTINTRADRAGNRPLHAAAKFDTKDNTNFSKRAASIATGQARVIPHHHHPDGSVINSLHPIPGFPGKLHSTALRHAPATPAVSATDTDGGTHPTEALLTQVLLGSTGIEVDALNVLGQTALHIACMKSNWPVARLLLHAGASPAIADRRGFTPGQLAYKRAMPIPADLVDILGDPPETGIIPPPREFIVDPDASTLLLCHELCILHRTCPPIERDSAEPPPENVRRLHVLVDSDTGILRTGEFSGLIWKNEARRAAIADILKVHEYSYVERVNLITNAIPDHPKAIAHLDGDTAVSRWSFEAAMRAAGSVCEAVDCVVAGDGIRNAFCAIRPPGHHAGPRGIVRCANDPEGGSHGFCLLNNVCIGAAYARCMYRNEGIRKIAIVDFDVHHGNGTEAIIRNLVPGIEKATIRTPFAVGEISSPTFRPWLDETDIQNVFFASTHGYGNRGFDQPGWFYPASGATHTSEAISNPAMVENPSLTDFILSQTWSRMGESSIANCCKIINVGLDLPEPDTDPQSRNMKQRLELRDIYRKKILPALRDFDPDLIFISAGFDGHRKDSMNFGYGGMVEDDYEWVTEQIVKIANTCCNGRVISVLEGGYKIHGGIVSPFARSVASHVRALVDGGKSRELYDPEDSDWESQFERHVYERRERKKEQEREQLRIREETQRRTLLEHLSGGNDALPEDPDAPSRKRRRNQVDYKELFKQMQQEGFAS